MREHGAVKQIKLTLIDKSATICELIFVIESSDIF